MHNNGTFISTKRLSRSTLLFFLWCGLMMNTEYHCFGQDSIPLTLIKKIPGNYTALETDRLGNTYVINASGTLIKFNNQGDSLAGYNDIKKYGIPTAIDASNPLRPLLFFSNYATIVALDQLLTKRFTIDLRKKNIFSAAAVCNAYDNNIWVYDNQNYRIVKIDQSLNIISESADLRQLLDVVPDPVLFKENGNTLQVYDSTNGLFIFDLYCGYKNKVLLDNWKNTSIQDNVFWGIQEGRICGRKNDFGIDCVLMPKILSNANAIAVGIGQISTIKADGLYLYKISR